MSYEWLEYFPKRAQAIKAIRNYFDAEGFIEVDTPVRIPAPANEPHIIPPASGDWFLRASPELQLKRLLAMGFTKLYQIGPCFRQGESGDRHSPEFTMLEWYRANATYLDVLDDMRRYVVAVAMAVNGSTLVERDGVQLDLALPWEIITVQEAMIKYAGWDPLEEYDQDRFDFDMGIKVEPQLPKDKVVVLMNYPAQAAALAQLSSEDNRVAERWEAYAFGIELCNAFGELVDPIEQRARFIAAREEKIACGEVPMPLDEEFLSALGSMPPSGGAALGVDRLIMVLTGAPTIGKVRFT
ncbi:MAG: EF-P lysine aminoacylase GenX [Kiritimatiellae bacterium]|nr:EF-P lysine aminoacylase GenX [Kiritimatiellia bacterium]